MSWSVMVRISASVSPLYALPMVTRSPVAGSRTAKVRSESTSAPLAVAPFGPHHDHVEGVQGPLHLEPVVAAPAGV